MPTSNFFMKQPIPDKAVSLSWMFLWLMLPLSPRGSLILLWLFGFSVLYQVFRNGIKKNNPWQRTTALLFLLFLAWNTISLVFDNDQTLWWKSLEKKASLLIIPLLLISIDQKKFSLEKWGIRGFFTGLFLSAIIMLAFAVHGLAGGEDFTLWTYHGIASPFKLGAIYASWYFSTALIYLVYRKQEPFIEKRKPVLLITFLFTLLLLASKLFIILTVPLLLWKLIKVNIHNKSKLAVIVAVLIIVIIASAPFLLRMTELKNSKFEVLKQDSFSYDTPFNGLTFRLLQWRLAVEILDNENAWFTGVGINSSQHILDQHYRLKGIYTGNPELGDTGYLGYNYHNQYLETLVGTGIPGLIILLLIIFYIFFNLRSKLLFPLHVYLITTLFFFTESVLERQAGILFFCLIIFTVSEKSTELDGDHTVKK